MLVSDAEAADAVAIADIHVRSWRTAYRGVMPDAVLDGLSVADRTQQWRRRLAPGSDGPLFVLIGRCDGSIGARAFYARHGFVPDGAIDLAEGVPQIRMRASLASSEDTRPIFQTHH